jgi:holo-[acyl-carrier protein] synthase
LAARFAAKEATIKVLREGVPWSSIEVRRSAAGWVELQLAGRAADIAAEGGLRDFALSLTHEAGLASAVVVAACDTPVEATA